MVSFGLLLAGLFKCGAGIHPQSLPRPIQEYSARKGRPWLDRPEFFLDVDGSEFQPAGPASEARRNLCEKGGQ